MKTRVSLYCRVSTADGRQDCQNQLMALRKYAKEQGWQIVGEYLDERSGRRADRPQFLKMMDAAKRVGSFDVLLFWSLDRLSREGSLKTLQTLHQLSLYGVKFRSMQEPYLDSLGVFGEPIVALISQIALMESQRIAARVRCGIAYAKSRGVKLGRPRLEIDRDAIVAMRETASLRQIARAHNISVPTVVRTLAQVA
jgi:DNA invertase Pin-like site-specific DNA recombinase